MQIVRRNFALKLLAVGLAILGWAYLRFAGNPIVAAAQFDQQLSVPIAAVNLPAGYIARFPEREAVVTLVTKRGEQPIKPDQIKAILDLSNKETGVYNVPVQLVAPETAVQSLSPASVTLTIERIGERSFPITVHYVGAPPNGIVVGDTRIQPETVAVRAPTSMLAQVSAVHADVALPSQPKRVDEMVRPIPVDASGAEVSGLVLAPDLVRVQMQFVAGSSASR
jgi:YbbR domain-containing protein